MSNIHDRISLIVRQYYDDNNSKFAIAIGTSEANVRNYRKSTVPKLDIIKDISNKLEINYEWLIEGVGAIKKDTIAREGAVIYSAPKKINGRKLEEQLVPLYDNSASAGMQSIFQDDKMVPLDHIKVPNLPKCDGAVRITGDSMYPLLKSGDIVLYKEGTSKDMIIWGEMYLVYIECNGEEYFAVKYLQQSKTEGHIRLISYNDHHQDKEFPIDCLKKWALVKASIRINSTI